MNLQTYLDKWQNLINQPTWHTIVYPEFQEILRQLEPLEASARDRAKAQIYDFFETNLNNGAIFLGQSGPDWDIERNSIDTAVIHHSSQPPGVSWQRLSAIQLIRLYAAEYAHPSSTDPIKPGDAIFSNHFKEEVQVFYGYHWLVRQDGRVERLLNDTAIGWQAGNWEINCHSIGICLDDDLETKSPSSAALVAVVEIIKQYPGIHKDRVLGHLEVNPQTGCPGELFLKEWKSQILEQL